MARYMSKKKKKNERKVAKVENETAGRTLSSLVLNKKHEYTTKDHRKLVAIVYPEQKQ